MKKTWQTQFSCSVMSNSLQPQGLYHARPPCPSPTPRVYSNSCPLSWWCHLAISSSVVPFPSHLKSFPASGSFQMSQLFASGGQSIGASASAWVFPVNIQDWFPLELTGWISLQSTGLKSLLQHHSSKPSIIRHSAFFFFFFFLHVKYVLLSFKRAQGLVLNQAAHLSSVWHLSHHIKLASASNTSLNPKEKNFLILKKIQFWEQLTLFCNLKQYEG